MITVPTVLIIGAGASVPYHFSSGIDLRNHIKQMHPRREYFQRNFAIEPSILKNLALAIEDSAPASIDLFLERKKSEPFRETGKKLIAFQLLNEELSSSDYMYSNPVKDHWYQYFWQKIYDPIPEKLLQNKLTIINFNYDRSLEYYLLKAIKSSYEFRNDDEAHLFFKSIKIIHPYGSLGSIYYKDKDYLPYGNDNQVLSSTTLQKAIKSIKIIFEGQDGSLEFRACHTELLHAQRIYIMGFGYHPTNINRLLLNNEIVDKKQCAFGTIGFTQHEIDTYIQPHLPYTTPKALKSENSDAMGFMRNYFAFS